MSRTTIPRNEIMMALAKRDPARFRTRTVESEARKQVKSRSRRKQQERREYAR